MYIEKEVNTLIPPHYPVKCFIIITITIIIINVTIIIFLTLGYIFPIRQILKLILLCYFKKFIAIILFLYRHYTVIT